MERKKLEFICGKHDLEEEHKKAQFLKENVCHIQAKRPSLNIIL